MIHKDCGGELVCYEKGVIYTLDVDVFKCLKCGAKNIDITSGEMDFVDKRWQ